MTQEVTVEIATAKQLELEFRLVRKIKASVVTIQATAADNLLPVGDAEVKLIGPRSNFSGRTSASGHKSFRVAESGTFSVHITHDNFKAFSTTVEIPRLDEPRTHTFTFALERKERRQRREERRMVVLVKAKFLDGRVGPLKGAMVRQVPGGGDTSRLYLRERETDEDGKVVFTHDAIVGTQLLFAAGRKGFSSGTETAVIGHASSWDWASLFSVRPDDYCGITLTQLDERTTTELLIDVKDSTNDKPVYDAKVVLVLVDTAERLAEKSTRKTGSVIYTIPREHQQRSWRAEVSHPDYKGIFDNIPPELLNKNEETISYTVFLVPKEAGDEAPAERTFIVAVKSQSRTGQKKGIPGARVSLKLPKFLFDETKTADASGLTEFIFKADSPYAQARPESPIVIRVAAQADGYQPREITVEPDFTRTHDSTEIILEPKEGVPFAVLVHSDTFKPIPGAVVQVRRRTNTAKSELEARTDDEGRAVFYIPAELAAGALFVAGSHPMYEDRWSDIPEMYLAPPGGAGDFIMYLNEKKDLGIVWELDKVVDDPQSGQGIWYGGPRRWTLINRSTAVGEGNNPPTNWTTVNVGGEIPKVLVPGMDFDITVTISARANPGVDWAQDAGLAAKGFIVTCTPPRDRDRAFVLSGLRATDTVTYHLKTTRESLSTNEVWIIPFLGGAYQMAHYIYKKKER
ncbi:MAG: hypothetical protein FJY80_10035 [Candidatus Aminicenantes bacterium]|nr:hypothetical protein [Candidatus Aminicenantes bacterium]